jgi:hypothetical protein
VGGKVTPDFFYCHSNKTIANHSYETSFSDILCGISGMSSVDLAPVVLKCAEFIHSLRFAWAGLTAADHWYGDDWRYHQGKSTERSTCI